MVADSAPFIAVVTPTYTCLPTCAVASQSLSGLRSVAVAEQRGLCLAVWRCWWAAARCLRCRCSSRSLSGSIPQHHKAHAGSVASWRQVTFGLVHLLRRCLKRQPCRFHRG